jgi:hypothetical protein
MDDKKDIENAFDRTFKRIKKQIELLAKINLMPWVVAILFIVIYKFKYPEKLYFLSYIFLYITAYVSLHSIISVKHTKTGLVGSFLNIFTLGLVIILFGRGVSNWFIVPLILLSGFLFVMFGTNNE